MIDVDLSKLSGECKRVNISLPARLLNLIDDYAAKSSETRSGLLVQAALEYIALQEEKNFAKKKVSPKSKKKAAAKKKTAKKQTVPR